MSSTGDAPGVNDPGQRHGELSHSELRDGELRIVGRLHGSSNRTFLVEVGSSDRLAVYKPAAGERPLWDFPTGLWRREVAAYELSDAMGLNLVPTTIHRVDGPYGEGSVQQFVHARFEDHYFTILPDAADAVIAQLRSLCMFDLLANSADRKAGHCLIDQEDHIWAIDNGLSFHEELKIRTVIWDFAGEPIPDDDMLALRTLRDSEVSDSIAQWLSPEEIRALVLRADWLIEGGMFPHDPSGRRYPWPLV